VRRCGFAITSSPIRGIENLTQAEADALVAMDTDYHTRDLFEAIGRGDYRRGR